MLPAFRERRLDLSARPLVMGILNVTPDSFSDGGRYLRVEAAVARAAEMINEGADIIDVGPESTRPGAQAVPAAEQIRRAVPVIAALRGRHPSLGLSVDTRLAEVAREALRAGADIVNDISALRDDAGLASVIAEFEAAVVLMHRRGTPQTMQAGGGPTYDDVVGEIAGFLAERIAFAEAAGIARDRIVVDPGLGFGKRLEDNWRMMLHLDRFAALGRPLLVGASRKSFLGALLAEEDPAAVSDPARRVGGSLACAAVAALSGAAIVRVHDVAATVQVLNRLAAAGGSA